MAFWSGETLKDRLEELFSPADPNSIDCAAYTLKVGPEYYVTPTDLSVDPKSVTLRTLSAGEAFAIPPGQFAWILTEEIVTVPTNALAFISIRARIKWKGLINISGFHVDGGFSGRLTYSVLNAGPTPIHLRRGDPTFLIWYANLDRPETSYAKATAIPPTKLNIDALNQISGEVHSLQGLADRIRSSEKELGSRITVLERSNAIYTWLAGAVMALLIGLLVQWASKGFPTIRFGETNAANNTIVANPSAPK
jgi:dCTP deaminase